MPKWRNVSEEIRFWDKVFIPIDGKYTCWTWQGGVWSKKQGYGSFSPYSGKTIKAHRWSFFWHNPQAVGWVGIHILHTCDNTLCVNPQHLYIGTNADNVRDKMSRGRHRTNSAKGENHWTRRRPEDIPRGDAYWTVGRLERKALGGWHNHTKRQRGEKHHNAVLTTQQVQEIKELYIPYEVSQYALARRYNTTRETIYRIIKGQTRKTG